MLRKIPLPPGRSHLDDLNRLTRTELRKKYKTTYNSWRNGKMRAKPHGNWDLAFNDFSDFLRSVGPCPAPGMTLDRIDNSNPKYGPGLCRWADRRQQATNRATTRQINNNGQLEPLPEVARRQGEHPGALRKRLERAGKLRFTSDPRRHLPWPRRESKAIQEMWEKHYHASGGFARWTRYEFLIDFLKRNISKKEEFIEENYDANDAEGRKEMAAEIDFVRKARIELERALLEKPVWEKAVRDYEIRQPERRFLRSGRPGYLDNGRCEEKDWW